MFRLPKTESQNVEFKEAWHDEYLKWICGFANAQGGTLWIGVADDGEPVGLPDAKRLLEDIPNKIQDVLGIVAEVSLQSLDQQDVICVRVSPSSFPVSCKGEYHYRSGSTRQQLRGNALTQFLLRKTGLSWDGASTTFSDVDNLPNTPFLIFRRRSVEKGRMPASVSREGNHELVERLHLFAEDGMLTKAGVLLFHDNPCRYVFGSVVRLGFFEGSELLYQDEVSGSILEQAERIPDLLFAKYMKMRISYDGTHRVETYPFPFEGVREAVFNAIVHKAYHDPTHTQIRVSATELRISNAAALPLNWSPESMFAPHSSHAYNPLIADAFFKAGFIETWGRGIQKIVDACAANGNPPPAFEYDGAMLTIVFKAEQRAPKAEQRAPKAEQRAPKAEQRAPKAEQRAPKAEQGSGKDIIPGKTELSKREGAYIRMRIRTEIRENARVTVMQLASLINRNERKIKKHLAILQQEGTIRRVGGRKFGHWEDLGPPPSP